MTPREISMAAMLCGGHSVATVALRFEVGPMLVEDLRTRWIDEGLVPASTSPEPNEQVMVDTLAKMIAQELRATDVLANRLGLIAFAEQTLHLDDHPDLASLIENTLADIGNNTPPAAEEPSKPSLRESIGRRYIPGGKHSHPATERARR